MMSEDKIKRELETLKHDIDYTDCSKRDYCRMYAMIDILERILEEKTNE